MLTLLQTLVAGALRLPKRRVKAEHDDGMIVIELGESATGGLLLALALVVATLLRVCCSPSVTPRNALVVLKLLV